MVVERGGFCVACTELSRLQKTRQTWRDKYGCDHAMQNDEVKEKGKETCRDKYSCDHPMQNDAVAEKSMKNAFRTKTYTFACGTARQVQGNEPHALRDLERQRYTAADLQTDRSSVPEVWWSDEQGVKHRYYVDIYIPREKRMIEVKGEYTYGFSGVQEKAKASRDAGFAYEIWVYDGKGVRLSEPAR